MSVVPGENYSIIKDDADTMFMVGPGVCCIDVIVVDKPSRKHQLVIGGQFIHTSNLSREPREYPCKFFLAGVNFYRFSAKNWHFTV